MRSEREQRETKRKKQTMICPAYLFHLFCAIVSHQFSMLYFDIFIFNFREKYREFAIRPMHLKTIAELCEMVRTRNRPCLAFKTNTPASTRALADL